MYLYPNNITNDSIEELLKDAFLLKTQEESPFIILENENRDRAESMSKLLKEYNPDIVMEHSLFARLLDPNDYLYRFIGRFPGEMALFEFFDNEKDDISHLKAKTRSAFEDSLFSLLLGNVKRAYSGFLTVIRLNPQDSVTLRYISICEKQLENHRDSDV